MRGKLEIELRVVGTNLTPDEFERMEIQGEGARLDQALEQADQRVLDTQLLVSEVQDKQSKAAKLAKDFKPLSDVGESLAKSGKLATAGEKLAKAGKFFLAALPIIGIFIGQASAAYSVSKGDYSGAALDEAGFIPFAGDLLDAGRGGYALGEALNEGLGIEEVAMKGGERFERGAKSLGFSEDAARVVGATGAALTAINEVSQYVNPITAPFKIASRFF